MHLKLDASAWPEITSKLLDELGKLCTAPVEFAGELAHLNEGAENIPILHTSLHARGTLYVHET